MMTAVAKLSLPAAIAVAGAIGAEAAAPGGAATAPKERATSLDGLWKFSKDGGPFTTVEVPHDWGIAGPFSKDGDGNTGKLPWKASGVYRRAFTCRKPAGGGAARLEFDGVMARPEVFVNGVRVGGWDYGYMSFWCDITEAVKDGENALEVRADTLSNWSRWYPGGGIYRSVRLVECDPGYTLPGSVFITTPQVTEESATVHVEWETRDGRHERTFTVENPELWSPETPRLYTVDVNGTEYRYGIRTCEWTPGDGFHLNGRRYQIRGANLHADFGPLGLAFHKGAARRQLEIMRSMGVNAIRTAHNPQAPGFLDLCDEMGFLVWDECFDKWEGTSGRRKEENLEEYVSRNLAAFVRRDRNHPCVVCWSISNEIRAATDSYPDGQTKERVAAFAAVVRSVDPTRPVGSGNCKPEGFPDKSIFEALDVTGWNYARAYAAQHAFDPRTQAVVMTESACGCSSRDWFGDAPPANKLDFDFKANEASAYDSCAAQFGDIPDVEFLRIERDRYCAGEFVWCGFDYLGEPYPFEPDMNKVPRPRQSRSSYFGCVDLTGLPKSEYYLYRSHWNRDEHTVRIVAPSDRRDASGAAVFAPAAYVYTDGDAAELFLNGRPLGMRRKVEDIDYPLDFRRDWPKAESCESNPYYAVCGKYRLRWFDIPAEGGELVAVAYREGREIGRDALRLPGKPARLEVEAEPERDGLLFLHVKLVDANGTVVQDASDRVEFALSGPGRIIAVGNGNANGYDSFSDTFSHPLYRGRALAIVRRTGEGDISLSATTPAANGPEPREATPKARIDAAWADMRRDGPLGEFWWANRFLGKAGEIEALRGSDVDLVMVGDSITQNWEGRERRAEWEKLIAGRTVLNLGFAGDSAQNVLWRLDHGELEGYEAKNVAILVGTNNAGGGSKPDNIAYAVEKIVRLVRARQPRARIILHAIFPRGRSSEDKGNAAARARIDGANAILSRFAATQDNLVWLDITDRLVDATGWVPEGIAADGLHPSAAGHAIWREALEEALGN